MWMLQCFIRILRIVAMAFQVCFMCVSQIYFKYFICLEKYVAIVRSPYFKSRSEVFVHVAMASVTGGQQLVVGLWLLPHAAQLTLSSPSPFPSLHFSATV
jgi:hypothetical protein